MSENVISVLGSNEKRGLSRYQFQKIDGVFLRASSNNILQSRTVDCDLEQGYVEIALAKSPQHPPVISFVAKKVGPRTTMYELYMEGKGRVEKSALFERVFERYDKEVEKMMGRR